MKNRFIRNKFLALGLSAIMSVMASSLNAMESSFYSGAIIPDQQSTALIVRGKTLVEHIYDHLCLNKSEMPAYKSRVQALLQYLYPPKLSFDKILSINPKTEKKQTALVVFKDLPKFLKCEALRLPSKQS